MNQTPEPVSVVDYDPDWPRLFERLRDRVLRALGDVAARVEHVGSKAVPGLPAKPIIDVDVVVRSPDDVRTAVERLESIGYEHEGDLGIPGREAFRWPSDTPRHHVYLLVEGARSSGATSGFGTTSDRIRSRQGPRPS